MSETRVYDAPSDLAGRWVRETDMTALRDENARLREALVAIQKSCKAQDEYSSWLLGITEAALQPERGSL